MEFKSVEMVAYNAVLPVLSTVVGGIVSYAQSTRNSVIAVANENLSLRQSKGVSQNGVVYKHILRNALLPIVTGLGMGLSGLIGGSVVIEKYLTGRESACCIWKRITITIIR